MTALATHTSTAVPMLVAPHLASMGCTPAFVIRSIARVCSTLHDAHVSVKAQNAAATVRHIATQKTLSLSITPPSFR